jgi:hypothetical protein
MDCKTALSILDVCRPNAKDVSDPAFDVAAAHVEECSECISVLRSRQSFDARLAACMQAVEVPFDLKDRIGFRLQRSVTRRRYLRHGRWIAAAAAVFLAAAIFYAWPRSTTAPREIDWESLGDVAVVDGSAIEGMRKVPPGLNTVQQVQAWCFRQQKQLRLPQTLPGMWRPLGLSAVGRTTVSGQAVAVLRFEDERGESEIIALPHQSFHITNLRTGMQLLMHTRELAVIAWAEQDATYVAVLKGWSRDDWLPLVRRSMNLT